MDIYSRQSLLLRDCATVHLSEIIQPERMVFVLSFYLRRVRIPGRSSTRLITPYSWPDQCVVDIFRGRLGQRLAGLLLTLVAVRHLPRFDMSSLMRKVIVNSASNIAVPLTSFFSAPILAHALGVVGRGEVAGATAPLFLLATAGALGLPEAVTYFAARSRLNLGSFPGNRDVLNRYFGHRTYRRYLPSRRSAGRRRL